MSDEKKSAGSKKYTGGCHCGVVRFEIEMDPSEGASRCNCSICTKMGVTGKIAKPAAFRLLEGKEHLSTYRWGGNISTRYFCKHCGIHCYGEGHLEQVGGDYVSVNLNTIDGLDPATLSVIHWDGRHDNWQAGPRPTPWPIHASE